MHASRFSPVLPVLAALAGALALGCLACASDPVARVHQARAQFAEVRFRGSAPDTEGGRLIVEVGLEKDGKQELDQLTLRVEQRNERGGVLRTDHVTLDVADFRPYETRDVNFQVPLADGAAGLAVSVEKDLDPRASYPEFEGLEGSP